MQNKKGVTVQTTIISIIIIVISAAIIFLFFKAIPYTETIDKEACYHSVILRNNAFLRGESIIPELIPLNCRTQEITISSTNKEFIKREIANAMYDCWGMLGEGKMQFFSESGWREFGVPEKGTAKANCVVCSIIRFEGKAKDKQINFLEYLEQTNIPSKNITYLNYLTNGEETKLPPEVRVDRLDTNQDYTVIFMGLKGLDIKRELIGAIGFGGGTSFFAWRTLPKIGLKVAGKILIIPMIVEVVMHSVTAATTAHAASIHCDGNLGGCFVLMLVPLTAEDIATQCQNIESIP